MKNAISVCHTGSRYCRRNEVLKSLGLPSRLVPLVSLALGIVVSHLFAGVDKIQDMIFLGVVFGLSSNGLFDVTKVFKD